MQITTESRQANHWKPGTPVWYRGLFANSFSLRGVVECLKDEDLGDRDYIGVRLENGNLCWADESRVLGRNL